MTRFPTVVALVLSSLLVPACGTGMIIFEPQNGGPPKVAAKDFKSFDIDCQDGFEKAKGGGQSAMGAEAGTYSVGCTRDGQPFSSKVLGLYHAAPIASGKWAQYRGEVTEKARQAGCPAVAVRKSPPTVNQEGEAIGAFCVEN